LGPVGAAIAAAAAEAPMPRPSAVRAATARLATSPRLHHLLEVNQFFCALAAHARHHSGAALLRWWPERRATHATGGLARPDGAGLWAYAGRHVPFWLELDRGTETLSRLAAKLTGYQRLAGTELAWPVLFWLPTRSRETSLHKLLTRISVGYVVATATGEAPDAHPAGPVWRLAGDPDTTRRPLHHIPPITEDPEPPVARMSLYAGGLALLLIMLLSAAITAVTSPTGPQHSLCLPPFPGTETGAASGLDLD